MRRHFLFVPLLALCWLAVPAQAQTGGTYTVQAGDTLFRIARTHAVDIDVLRRLNGIEGDYITVGQTLRLSAAAAVPAPRPVPPQPEAPRPESPREPPAPDASPRDETPEQTPPDAPDRAVHVVESGETLFRIALRYGRSVEELRRLNDIEGDRIEVGQRLVVSGAPGAVRPSPEAAPAERPVRPSAAGPRPARPIALSQARPWSIEATTVPADLIHFSEPGETLYSIAARYGLSLEALLSGNALSTAPLPPGTAVHLPTRVRPSEAAERRVPDASAAGLALVYPDVMSGRTTSSGEVYDSTAFAASHRSYPFGTLLLITNPASGRSTFVRVIDRGPVSEAYLIELSAAAATALELDPNAAQRVEIREIP